MFRQLIANKSFELSQLELFLAQAIEATEFSTENLIEINEIKEKILFLLKSIMPLLNSAQQVKPWVEILDSCQKIDRFTLLMSKHIASKNIVHAKQVREKIMSKINEISAMGEDAIEHSQDEILQRSVKTKLLYAEQSYIARHVDLAESLQVHLKNIKKVFHGGLDLKGIRCFISYAWPTEANQEMEFWVQPFLKAFRYDLELAGIDATLDIVDNKFGNSIYNFMKSAEASEFAILVGTSSLKEKHHSPFGRAIKTELNHLARKHDKDAALYGASRIFPLLISGSHQDSFPERYTMYSTIDDMRDRKYIDNLKHYITFMYEFTGASKKLLTESKTLWEKFACEWTAIFPKIIDTTEESLNYKKKKEEISLDPIYHSIKLEVESGTYGLISNPSVLNLKEEEKSDEESEEIQLNSPGELVYPGLSFTPIIGNGNCLYEAIGVYLGKNADFVINIIIRNLFDKRAEYEPLIRDRLVGDQSFDEYVNGIKLGDEFDIPTLMRLLDSRIIVVYANGDIDNFYQVPNCNRNFIFIFYDGANRYNGFVRTMNLSGKEIIDKVMLKQAKKSGVDLTPRLNEKTRDIDFTKRNKIDFTHMLLYPEEVLALVERDFFKISRVGFRRNSLEENSKSRSARIFSDHIKINMDIEEIDLAYSFFLKEDLNYLLKQIENSLKLRTLILKGMGKKHIDIQAIHRFLLSNTMIENLDLQGVHKPEEWDREDWLTADDLEEIFSPLAWTSLVTLNLWGNRLGDAGANKIALYLKKQLCHLKFIGLGRNNIGPAGAKDIAESLHNNLSLVTLDLRFNRIGNIGLSHLLESLEFNKTLLKLNIENNFITSIGIEQFIIKLRILFSNDKLNLLYVSFEKGGLSSLKHNAPGKIKLDFKLKDGFFKEIRNDIGMWRGVSIMADYISQYSLGLISRSLSSHNDSLSKRQKSNLVSVLEGMAVRYLQKYAQVHNSAGISDLISLSINELIDSEIDSEYELQEPIKNIFCVIYSSVSSNIIENYLSNMKFSTSEDMVCGNGLLRYEHLSMLDQLLWQRDQESRLEENTPKLLKLYLNNNKLFYDPKNSRLVLFDRFKDGHTSCHSFLQKVVLSGNYINDSLFESFIFLFSLGVFPDLVEVDFSDNRITEKGTEKLKNDFSDYYRSLESLNLSNNYINLSGFFASIRGDSQRTLNKHLKINIGGNHISLDSSKKNNDLFSPRLKITDFLPLSPIEDHSDAYSFSNCTHLHFYFSSSSSATEAFNYSRKSTLCGNAIITDKDWVLKYDENAIYLEGILSTGVSTCLKISLSQEKTIVLSSFDISGSNTSSIVSSSNSDGFSSISSGEAKNIISKCQSCNPKTIKFWTEDLLLQADIIEISENEHQGRCINFRKKIRSLGERKDFKGAQMSMQY